MLNDVYNFCGSMGLVESRREKRLILIVSCSGSSQLLIFLVLSSYYFLYPSASSFQWLPTSFPQLSLWQPLHPPTVTPNVGVASPLGGGNNIGRVGVITHEEKHPGSFEMVHIKVSTYVAMSCHPLLDVSCWENVPEFLRRMIFF